MASGSGVEKDALGSFGVAQAQGENAYGVVNPIYSSMATSPTGYTPQDKANMITRAGQSVGGGNAVVVGQGALTAARTGNVGAAPAVADSAARASMAQQSDNTLGVDAADEALKRQNQLTGLSGLNSIYAGANRTADDYLNTANNTKVPFWEQYVLNGQKAAMSAAAAGGG